MPQIVPCVTSSAPSLGGPRLLPNTVVAQEGIIHPQEVASAGLGKVTCERLVRQDGKQVGCEGSCHGSGRWHPWMVGNPAPMCFLDAGETWLIPKRCLWSRRRNTGGCKENGGKAGGGGNAKTQQRDITIMGLPRAEGEPQHAPSQPSFL